jgi:cyclic pyranopterin monophosphate synthase
VDRLTHVDDEGSPQMVDISGKSASLRVAVAEGALQLLPSHVAALGNLPKGDALTVAQISGIQGGKRCSELIPLCHQVPLTHLDVEITLEQSALRITATAKTEASTGVEMEAYTAVVVAGITLIDMLKGVDPDLQLTGIKLLRKTGGKSDWNRD